MTVRRAGFWSQYFYFFMSLLIAVVVVYGFSHTIGGRLIHPKVAPPRIIYLHAAVFSGWIVFLILQTALVRMRKVRVHRTIGWFGVAIGVMIPVVGISTAISMDRFNIFTLHESGIASFMAVQFCDMISFTVAFALAVYWRRKPEFHRRLMLVASFALTAAAWGRMPPPWFSDNWFYIGVDFLVFLGLLRDVIVMRRVHPVYRYALPALIAAQSTAMYLVNVNPPVWQRITARLLG